MIFFINDNIRNARTNKTRTHATGRPALLLALLMMVCATMTAAAQTVTADSLIARQMREQGVEFSNDNSVTLLMSGQEKFDDMFKAIRQARSSVHLEYFNFRNDSIASLLFDILAEKASQGVEVRVLFDGFGNDSNNQPLKKRHLEKLRQRGVDIHEFDPLRFPWVNHVFHRDHRKIVVIDGQIAFTGGVNLADEYINKIVRFGYWKDSGVRLDGPGAASLANIFLTFWKAKYPDEDLDADCDLPAAVPVETDCLVQPFADTPVDREAVAKNVYLELINQAQKRLYICTPFSIRT